MAWLRRLIGLPAAVVIALATVIGAYKTVDAGRELRLLDHDLATLRAVRYGVLDPDAWAAGLSEALSRRVHELELSPADRTRIEEALAVLISKFIEEMEATVRDAPTLVDELLAGPRPAMDLVRRYLGDWQAFERDLEDSVEAIGAQMVLERAKMRENVDAYAAAILDRAGEQDVREELALLAEGWLRRWLESSFSRADQAPLDAVLARHGCETRSACIQTLERAAADRRKAAHLFGWAAVAGLSLLLSAAAVAGRTMPQRDARWIALAAMSGLAAVMVAGTISPMMKIEAEIETFAITVLDQPIRFEDQLLYHRSESILDLARILMTASEGTVILVGAMVLLFSVLLPSAKLAASVALLFGAGARWLEFLASKTAKWAMADVFVVAVLMAALGIDGVITDAAGGLGDGPSGIHLSSAEGTTLQIGYYLFLAFAIGNIVLAEVVESLRGAPGDGRETDDF